MEPDDSDWDIIQIPREDSPDASYDIIDFSATVPLPVLPKLEKKPSTSTWRDVVTNLYYNFTSPKLPYNNKVKFDSKRRYIVMMGVCYTDYETKSKFGDERTIRRRRIGDEFQTQFKRLIWATYKSGLQGMEHASDTNWGCVIRSVQMLICNALKPVLTFNAVKLIKDNDPGSTFSIQNILQTAMRVYPEMSSERRYTPAQMCYIVSQIPFEYANIIALSEPVISFNMLLQEAKEWRVPILLLVPLMLGVERLNEEYRKPLRNFFNLPQCVGIVGGKPDSAYYFVGYQKHKLLYLDPHFVQDVTTDQSKYSCATPRLLRLADMESSLAIGFLLKSELDMRDLLSSLDQNLISVSYGTSLDRSDFVMDFPDLSGSSMVNSKGNEHWPF